MEKPWQPESTPSYWINRASRALSRRLDTELRPFGFALAQLPVLGALAAGPPLSQAELARVACVEQPSMAETLARMTRDGVVDRAPHPDDGRAALVSLSRRSRSRLPRARAALLAANADAMRGLSPTEQRTLCRLLERVVRNVDAAAPAKKGARS